MVLVDVIIPVVCIAGAGYLFARWSKLDVSALTKLSFYVLVPVLIFHSMLSSSISGATVANVGLFVLVVHGALLALGWVGARAAGWDEDTRAAAAMSLSFANCGNYGLPIVLFAFGDAGFTLGVTYMVAHQVFQVLFGVSVANWKKGVRFGAVAKKVLTVPWLYAMILALGVRTFSVDLPIAVSRPIDLMAEAAIPLQLLVLGMALAQVKVGKLFRFAAPVSALKLVLPPFLAWCVCALLGLDGLLRAVLIVEAATPTAVNALILSLQYERRPDLTAAIVLLTTIGGVGVTALLLWLLA